MKRRQFLQALSLMPLAGALPSFMPRIAMARGVEDLFTAGNTSWAPGRLITEGKWPDALSGTLYRNSPVMFKRNGYRYEHWVDGDGLIQQYRISSSEVEHQARFVQTPKYKAEQKANRFLYAGSVGSPPNAIAAVNNDSVNAANTSIRKIGDKLLALWEAGSAFEIDPDTLDTLGMQTWAPELKHMPFSAHPLEDANGDWWNIGSWIYGDKPVVVVYQIDKAGKLKKYKLLGLNQSGYMHAFTMSQRYLVLVNSALIYKPAENFLNGFTFNPQGSSQIVLIDKNTLQIARTIEIPANFMFHFGNAYEVGDELHFSVSEYANGDVMLKGMSLSDGSGFNHPELFPSPLTWYRVNVKNGQWQRQSSNVSMEFPNYRLEQPYDVQTVFGIGQIQDKANGSTISLVSHNSATAETQSYQYSENVFIEEPLLIRDRQGVEYVIQTWLDWEKQTSGVSLFERDNIAAGPVANARSERPFPIGFHGSFINN